MDRWTMQELERTDDLSFAISLLNKKKNELNPFSPLSMKCCSAIKTLENIKAATERYHEALAAALWGDDAEEGKEQGDDLKCEPCAPTQPECGACEFAGGEDDAEVSI